MHILRYKYENYNLLSVIDNKNTRRKKYGMVK